MQPGDWVAPEGEGPGPPTFPDVVGLELRVALERLKRQQYALRFTAPPRPRGEKGAVRVVACRRQAPGGAVEVICAREYWDRPPATGTGQGTPDSGDPTGGGSRE